MDQISLFDPRDPFTGSSNPARGWQANKRRNLCVASNIRAMPENEKPTR